MSKSEEFSKPSTVAATASPEWIAARDQFHKHLFDCGDCNQPEGHYCATGADLRQSYEDMTYWDAVPPVNLVMAPVS